jgi:KUP system potassium uptake protein
VRPYVARADRVEVEHLSPRLVRVSASFGFMEQPRIAPVLRACDAQGLQIDDDETSFFYSDPKIVHARGGLPAWRRELFDFLLRVSRRLPDDMHIVAHRRVELGVEVAI